LEESEREKFAFQESLMATVTTEVPFSLRSPLVAGNNWHVQLERTLLAGMRNDIGSLQEKQRKSAERIAELATCAHCASTLRYAPA
jgi:hypothetical protein